MIVGKKVKQKSELVYCLNNSHRRLPRRIICPLNNGIEVVSAFWETHYPIKLSTSSII